VSWEKLNWEEVIDYFAYTQTSEVLFFDRFRYGVTRIGIFGSVARSQTKSDSDVDIVVELIRSLAENFLRRFRKFIGQV